jgi:hypothetical protein
MILSAALQIVAQQGFPDLYLSSSFTRSFCGSSMSPQRLALREGAADSFYGPTRAFRAGANGPSASEGKRKRVRS